MRIAQPSAKKDGLGRPFFSAVRPGLAAALAMLGLSAWAQTPEAIYRCGQEYTNTPQGKGACVRLASPGAVTVIEGTQVNGSTGPRRTLVIEGPAVVPVPRPKVEPQRADAPLQRERDTQARTIVAQELEKARQQQAQLMQSYRQAASEKADAHGQAQPSERLNTLKAALERNQRDIDSLQRELARRPMASLP